MGGQMGVHNPGWRSRRANGCKMEWIGTRGMRWGFPWEVPVRPKLGEVNGCVVGNYIGMGGWLGVWGVEELGAGRCVGAGGAGQGGDCYMSARPKVEAGGRSVAGRIVEAGGDVFRIILIVFRVDTCCPPSPGETHPPVGKPCVVGVGRGGISGG